MTLKYTSPRIHTEKSFETGALACGKTSNPPPGSHHFSSAYDTFTGHFSMAFGGSASDSGSAGIGFGTGGTTLSYYYSGLCMNWVTYVS